MKTIVWIDDDTSQLARISESLFPTLWKDDVRNRMILIGDNYKEDEPAADRKDFIDSLFNDITGLFYQFCYEEKGDKTLDEYYKDKEGIIPEKPDNLSDNSSCNKVVEIIEGLIQGSKADDTIIVGVDISLNNNSSKTGKYLTDKILVKLLSMSDVKKIFIYSNYNPDEYPDTKAFKEKYNNITFFREQVLATKDSDAQIEFFKLLDI
jgi:hypothetical protein